MKIRVRLFAHLRDRVGSGSLLVALPPRSRASDVLKTSDLACIRSMRRSLRFAIRDEFVPAGFSLKDGETLLIFPPMSGG